MQHTLAHTYASAHKSISFCSPRRGGSSSLKKRTARKSKVEQGLANKPLAGYSTVGARSRPLLLHSWFVLNPNSLQISAAAKLCFLVLHLHTCTALREWLCRTCKPKRHTTVGASKHSRPSWGRLATVLPSILQCSFRFLGCSLRFSPRQGFNEQPGQNGSAHHIEIETTMHFQKTSWPYSTTRVQGTRHLGA